MVVSVAGTATVGEAATATEVVCNVPAGVLAGELLVALVTHSAATATAIPDQAGWTTVGKATMANLATAMFYRVATGSEPASYTFTGLTSGRVTGQMVRLTGVDTATPLDAPAATKTTGSTTSLITPDVVTATAGALMIYDATLQAAAAGNEITPDPATTLLANTTGTGRRTIMASEARPAAGATGTRTWASTTTTALNMAGIAAAFRPAAGGAATAPVVSAGADATVTVDTAFARTATESDGGAAITARSWTIFSGPTGAATEIGTTAALSWTPTVTGEYVLRYSATNSVGTSTDDVTVTVTATPVGTLTFLITGDPDGDSVPVTAKTAAAGSVRLKVATDAGMSIGVVFTAAVTPDADQYSAHTITGLTPGTHYWYRAEVDGVLAAELGEFITDIPGAARSFRVAFGSCLSNGNLTTTAFDHVIANAPELFLHLGDWHYDDSTSSDAAVHRVALEEVVTGNVGMRDMLRRVPLAYTWSDHDSGNNDWTGGPAAWTPSYNAAYRTVIPTGTPLPNPGGIYRSVHRGRVKFILTDGRSFKSPKANADDAAKTMFGAAQEAWIAAELADPAYPVKVICLDVPWVYPTTAGDDKWGGYKAAAQRLVDAITAAGANVFLIHGDAHSLCADDGTSANNTGSLPVAGAAPLGNSTSIKGGPYSAGTYPTSATIGTVEQQHGLLDITDAGDTITVLFSGRGKANTERVTLTKAFAVTEPAPGGGRVTDRWSGSALVRQRVDRWDGTALAQQASAP